MSGKEATNYRGNGINSQSCSLTDATKTRPAQTLSRYQEATVFRNELQTKDLSRILEDNVLPIPLEGHSCNTRERAGQNLNDDKG